MIFDNNLLIAASLQKSKFYTSVSVICYRYKPVYHWTDKLMSREKYYI